MIAESQCSVCDVKRGLIGVIQIADDYEMRSFKCEKCGSTFRFVERRKPQRRQRADLD